MVARLIRIKFAAVLLGPEGIGLLSFYLGNTDLWKKFLNFGVSQSGVKTLVSASSESETNRIKSALFTYFFTVSIICIVSFSLFSPTMAWFFLGDSGRWKEIVILSIVTALGLLASHGPQLLQASREVSAIARVNLFSAVSNALISFFCFKYYGINGVLGGAVFHALVVLFINYGAVKKMLVLSPRFPINRDFWADIKPILKLGGALTWNGVFALAVAQAVRVYLNNVEGINAVAYYSAAFSLSALFLNFVLSAMAADYFPTLCKLIDSPSEANNLANKQIEMGVLLSLAGLLATVLLAPEAIVIAYTDGFEDAIPLMRTFALGCAFRVLNWPLGFFLLAGGRSALFAGTQTFYQSLHLCGSYLGYIWFGFEGLAYGFLMMNILAFFVNRLICRREFGYRGTSNSNFATVLILAVLSISYLICFFGVFEGRELLVFRLSICALVGVVSIWRIFRLLEIRSLSDLKVLARSK